MSLPETVQFALQVPMSGFRMMSGILYPGAGLRRGTVAPM